MEALVFAGLALFLFVVLPLWLSVRIAGRKGRSRIGAFFLTLFLGWLGTLIVALMQPDMSYAMRQAAIDDAVALAVEKDRRERSRKKATGASIAFVLLAGTAIYQPASAGDRAVINALCDDGLWRLEEIASSVENVAEHACAYRDVICGVDAEHKACQSAESWCAASREQVTSMAQLLDNNRQLCS